MTALPDLHRLVERDGFVSPESVLAEARPEASPLHQYFTWDDSAAAEQWRLDQASRLIRRYSVEIQTEPEKVIRPRAFVNIGPRQYVAIDTAMHDPRSRDVVLASAIRELAALRRKYENLCDFDLAVQKEVQMSARKKAS